MIKSRLPNRKLSETYYVLGFRDFCEAAYSTERSLRDLFPSFVARALAYFKSASANLRASSVALVTRLVLTCDGDVLREMALDAADAEAAGEAVCRGMAGLVASDKSAVVQEAAALNLGKVFVHFRKAGSRTNGGSKACSNGSANKL